MNQPPPLISKQKQQYIFEFSESSSSSSNLYESESPCESFSFLSSSRSSTKNSQGEFTRIINEHGSANHAHLLSRKSTNESTQTVESTRHPIKTEKTKKKKKRRTRKTCNNLQKTCNTPSESISSESNDKTISETFRELNGLFATISSSPALVFSELEIKTVATKLLCAAAALADTQLKKEKEFLLLQKRDSNQKKKAIQHIKERLIQRKSGLEGADAMFGTLQKHPDLLEMFSKNQKELANLLRN